MTAKSDAHPKITFKRKQVTDGDIFVLNAKKHAEDFNQQKIFIRFPPLDERNNSKQVNMNYPYVQTFLSPEQIPQCNETIFDGENNGTRNRR